MLPVLLALLLPGCAWYEAVQECRPACEKLFDASQCGIDAGVIDTTAVQGCVARCTDQSERVRTDWIYCVAGSDCDELLEGECVEDWVLQGATGTGEGGSGTQVPIDTGEGW